ncbi:MULTISPECIES: type II secretion system F family protein [Vibrio]|jgi:tight adherence protein B|uniref:Pilus assembly protein TadB n=1 Tax=Vibrio toranzoniae TaxID=1194427 RepID=A0A109D7U7_9VIBR|nr:MULTISPECIES: type II secretion system F family protein [Vibrio]KWU00503.1 pilus assembly protein TadB [Vibrio toranzoniae]MDA0146438.1 type II secretion system F family protein [Vibrio sp. RW]NAZ91280.1 pilus assembly protein TadB [Vibrio toranzoniae]NAZ96697.1 pilus assembly protein TadB [Vibrio toranzoniae]SBS35621.1 Bacterial type II secretion system protein F domain protein [Vibrio toranzoniae]
MDNVTVSLALLFVAVLFISQALLLPAAGKKAKHKELSRRLKETQRNIDEESLSLLKDHYNKELSPIDRKLIVIPFFADLKRMLELAGLKITLSRFLLIVFLCGTLLALTALVFNQVWFICVALFVFAWVLAYLFVQNRVTYRIARFEEQLPDALDIIRRALQAGQPLVQSFNEVGEEMPEPIGGEFKNTYNLLNYGYDLRLAILQMSERIPTVSMLAFSSAVMLQKETGGNLSENLQKVSEVLRARFKLERKIRTLSAESRLSAWILTLSPFALFFGLKFVNPEYIEPLYSDPRGVSMVSIGVILLAIGALWIRKIINIEI